MEFPRTAVIASVAAVLIVSTGVVGGIGLIRNRELLYRFVTLPKQPELRPVVDERADSAKQPLPQVWERYVKKVPYYSDEFENVLRSRLRHRRFEELETYANEIRSKSARMNGGKWLLANFYEALEEPSAGPDAPDDQWEAHLALLDEWRRTFPESITATVAYAEAMIEYAWHARSDSYASSVTDAQWELFRERLQSAQDVLIAATEREHMCPQWFTAMLSIGLGQSWDREDYMATFNEANEYYPTYGSNYGALATYLLPRWNGKEGEWATTLAQLTDQQGTEEAHAIFQRTFSNIVLHYYEYDEIATDIKKHWPRIKRGYYARKKLYNVVNADMNDIARMAYLAGDRDVAREAFRDLKDHRNLNWWENDADLFDQVKAWANEKE
jgi:hypothetical protein